MQDKQMEVLEAIKMFSDMGLNSTGGLSNNSNGMPKHIRPIMDSALVAMCMMQGLISFPGGCDSHTKSGRNRIGSVSARESIIFAFFRRRERADSSEFPVCGKCFTASCKNFDIIYNLLCRELGFQGLVFTDALEMKGISQNENICAQALIAGNDLLLAPRNLKRELDGVLNAVKSGKLSEELITEKCRIYHVCSEVLAHQAESRVGDVLHRGEEYGAWAQVYIFNLHNLSGFVRKSTEKSLPLHTLIQKEMMKHSISDFEIMAPVGSRESLAAAIQAGADSIYFGIENLNMRARSANTFTIDDLREIARTCDEHGMKSYLTVNTIIYDHDIPLMRTIVDAAKAAGISAVIAADVAVMSYARQIGQEVHLSTQLNISNVEALRFYAQFADVVVLARELNLEQVAEIYRHIREENICGPSGEQIRIEMFCHGALCMAVSGKCYLSLHEMNHSANRGACMQVCRRSYTVRDKETDVELEVDNQYIMSPKDLKTIHFMNKMLDAGVRVFKIEGRARGPEYVRTVVECYKEAIRSYLDDTFTDEKIARWDERLKTVFNRGFWDGYYLGQRLGEWTKNYG